MAFPTKRPGSAAAGEFYGRDVVYYLIGNTANTVGTADTIASTGELTTEGNFTKAIRGINSVASIEMVGARSDAGFLVGVTGHDGRGAVAAAANLVAVIEAATGLSDVSATAKTLAHAQFA